jgi:hypothetical protein
MSCTPKELPLARYDVLPRFPPGGYGQKYKRRSHRTTWLIVTAALIASLLSYGLWCFAAPS